MVLRMEAIPFELTPAQKDLLESLARETGKAIPALLDEALEELKAHVRQHAVNGEPHSGYGGHAALPSHEAPKPIWEQFIEAFKDVPGEELECLPVDGAAQHDHYLYGLPKRPA
jgi:hypothetical protein